jgi:DNA-binding transcriptional MerR regulator
LKKKNEVAELIDKLKQSDISIRKISKLLDIPEQRMYGWTNKNAMPSYEDIQKLKQYFGYVQNNWEVNEPESEAVVKISLTEKVKAHDALLHTLVLENVSMKLEIAELKGKPITEPLQSLVQKIYKAAQDAGKSLHG